MASGMDLPTTAKSTRSQGELEEPFLEVDRIDPHLHAVAKPKGIAWSVPRQRVGPTVIAIAIVR
jgi:hypothetical protein